MIFWQKCLVNASLLAESSTPALIDGLSGPQLLMFGADLEDMLASQRQQISHRKEEMSEFTRENRYLVLKASDMVAVGLTEVELDQLQAICAKVDQYRVAAGKPDLECVVVEKDWPEYEPTWQAIEHRMASAA